jgi:hypothetical protein
MDAHDAIAFADRGSDNSHPTVIANGRGTDLNIEREAPLAADRVAAQGFERGSGMFGIMGQALLASHGRAAAQSEDIVRSPRPDQGIVLEVAFPQTGMMNSECSDRRGLESIAYGRVQDVPELEPAGMLPQGPGLITPERKRERRSVTHLSRAAGLDGRS